VWREGRQAGNKMDYNKMKERGGENGDIRLKRDGTGKYNIQEDTT
jgi:hypothetical protein